MTRPDVAIRRLRARIAKTEERFRNLLKALEQPQGHEMHSTLTQAAETARARLARLRDDLAHAALNPPPKPVKPPPAQPTLADALKLLRAAVRVLESL